MKRLFGTDGIRGVANDDLTPDLALAVGRAAGLVLAPDGGEFIVGRDTRLSGPMLESALVAGLASSGADVKLAGIIPTPGVAFMTVDDGARAGAVISASHNPVADNGIKFFSAKGTKIAADVEIAIEGLMAEPPAGRPVGTEVGNVEPLEDAAGRYVDHLVSCVPKLNGVKVVLDCAYGAAYEVGPQAFRAAGAEVVAINAVPDGRRINVECGSTSLMQVAAAVRNERADLGLAFDGDADRVLAVDHLGEPVDGDCIIAMSARRMLERDELSNRIVVTTVMANLGFRRALEAMGIDVIVAPVGDKHVSEAMLDSGASLGGEQSGHVIFGAHTPTGDGVLTAMKVAEAVADSGRPLADLARVFEPYPQVLINVPVASKHELERAEALWNEVRRAEASLGADGRILVRASGTEALVRVMVEAADAGTARSTAEELADATRRHLG